MCSVLLNTPVTVMSDRQPATQGQRAPPRPQQQQQNRNNKFSARPSLPSKDPSREDLELAQQLVGHAQGRHDNTQMQVEQSNTDSPSPYGSQITGERTVSSEQRRHSTPDSPSSADGDFRDNSYAPAQSDSVPSGQVCRYVHQPINSSEYTNGQ